MYKKQMTLQRIVCYMLLVAAALVFIYSLGLMTDLYDSKFNFYAENYDSPMVAGTQIYYDMQGFNRSLTKWGLILILLAVSQFLFQNHVRRKYYIANYITVGINAVTGIYASVWAVSNVFTYKEQFLQVDFEALATYAGLFGFTFTESTFWFDASAVVFGILMIVNVINILNLIWKVSLMKAEKKLIEEGREV